MKTYFASNLKHLMDTNRMSATDIATALGVSQPAVSKWLKMPDDEMPSVSVQNLIKLSEIFGVSVDSLIKRDLSEEKSNETPLWEKINEALNTLRQARDELKNKGRKFRSVAHVDLFASA